MKLTEDETIEILIRYLIKEGWKIDSHCLGQTRGYDINASKDGTTLLIEVKGARAGDNSPTKRLEYFNSTQINIHLGAAIVKALNDKHKNPQAQIAIAHPNDPSIKKRIGHLTPYLKALEIRHFWVDLNGTITED